ncbi:MAG TPA: hypothetical protein VFP97_11625, partial [Chitinophagaceae bacterium]|nr:hypothetical protein [Chitinophagaceae bacterium]
DKLEGKATFTVTAKDLEKYVGVFQFEGVDIAATTTIKENALWVSAPGQGEYELVPLSLNTFTVKGVQGYTLKFEVDGDKAVGLTAIQPNGTFKAKVKN